MNKSLKRLNILPLYGDFSLLIIGLFVLSLLMAISSLQNAAIPENIPTDKYFTSGVDTLTTDAKNELKLFITDSIFHKINSILEVDPNNLINIRIDGHTDSVPPDSTKMERRRWKTNRELSQFRANEIAALVEYILKSKLPDSLFRGLKNKILPSGFGSSKPQAIPKLEGNSWYVRDWEGKVISEYLHRYSSDRARRISNKLNRRVEINIISKAY